MGIKMSCWAVTSWSHMEILSRAPLSAAVPGREAARVTLEALDTTHVIKSMKRAGSGREDQNQGVLFIR